MSLIKSAKEIDLMRESCSIVSAAIKHIKKFVKVGVTTAELDNEIESVIVNKNAVPAFKGYALDVQGNLSEGSGENVFAVKDNVLYTPPLATSILPCITRASVMQLAEEAGYRVKELSLPREMAYVADELFFTGTAAEITPIRSVDKVPVGNGKPGPITLQLQKAFFEVVKDGKDTRNWLKFV